ncbi:MAG TPA: P-loop NTPase fold protein [Methylocystis sp.]|jgi:hypothetical protein
MTTSMEMTKAEITRFLGGNEPAVLCVTGEWGVGKTFLWKSVLDDLRKSNGLSLTRYSYVSLFGLNSLDDVKSSLFENMEWLDQDPTNFAQKGKAGAQALGARAKKLSELAGALPWVGQAFTKARSLYFSLIQNQIVCIDDLERRSKNLEVKDVLGLISFLREHRKCKVALLLNSQKLGDKKDEFEGLLEKVIEAKVVLAPTAAESASIALPAQDAISIALQAHCETLGIRNIRVIKQIERLARRVDELLIEFPQPIRDQAIHSLTLFGWAKYDRENSPKLEFLKTSSVKRYLSEKPLSKEEAAWTSLLSKYKFGRADDFDLALMNYVDSMILEVDDVQDQARALQEQQRLGALNGTLEAAWRAYHESFDDDEDRVVQELVTGTKKSYEITSLSNLNVVVSLLKGLGREVEAGDLLKFFAENRNDSGYWNSQNDPFERGPLDPDINAVIEQKKPTEPKDFDVAAGLIRAGKDYDPETIARLAAVSAQTYCDLISAARGGRKEDLVLSALEFRRIANASDDMRRVVSLMEDALRMVGRKSRLNAMRIRKYGVSIEG